MAHGENGTIGRIVLCLVEEHFIRGQEYATVLPRNSEVTARLMDLPIPKLEDATEILVQVRRRVEFFKR